MNDVGFDNVHVQTAKSVSKWMTNKMGFSFDYEAHGVVDIEALVQQFREAVVARVPVKEVDREV